ncbi:MAG: FAD:protein FMN transferase [Planctomycetota bacterium]
MTTAGVTECKTVVVACSAMATRFELVLCGDDPAFLQDAGEAALDDIRDAHDRLSKYERTSVISAINQSAGRSHVRIDDEVFDLLNLAERVRIESDNTFNITLGTSPLSLDPHTRTAFLPDPTGTIDLGGIGKGHALDLAATTLLDAGITSALLHGGTSTITAIGTRPDGKPWTVRIADDFDAHLVDESLSISNAIDGSQHQREHIVGSTNIAAAAVKHASAAEADAWSTAIVAGSWARPPQHARQTKHRWHISKDWNR